jgi:hypothetical protein
MEPRVGKMKEFADEAVLDVAQILCTGRSIAIRE